MSHYVQNSLFTAHTKSVIMPGVPPVCRTGYKVQSKKCAKERENENIGTPGIIIEKMASAHRLSFIQDKQNMEIQTNKSMQNKK